MSAALPSRPLDPARRLLLRDVIRIRLVAVPLVIGFGVSIGIMDPAPWRVAGLAIVLPVVLVLSIHERIHLQQRRGEGWDWTLNVLGIVAAQLSVAFLTGGLVSPANVASLILAFAVAVAGSSSARGMRAGSFVLQAGAFFAFAAVQTSALLPRFIPTLFEGMARPGPGLGPWTVAALYSFLALMTSLLGGRVGEAVRAAYVRRLDEREETLHLLREHAAELSQLTAEIAHELKNPMASVKGLAALLGRGAEGKEEERIAVLRREIDRMQSSLDELLTLSRPLVPLHRRPTVLEEIGREVLELHAGIAEQKGVGLELDVRAEAIVPCDARKVRQVLANLVQNALDFTPDGSRVTLEVSADEDAAYLSVRDAGPGIDPSLGDRVFERGVTSKENGYGIGLGVARMLARQHGGELVLESAPGGGCLARVTLPRGRIEKEGA